MVVTSSVANSITGSSEFDFSLLSFAVLAVYLYVIIIPLLLWFAAKYYKCNPSLIELWSLYGYGLVVWIPIAVGY